MQFDSQTSLILYSFIYAFIHCKIATRYSKVLSNKSLPSYQMNLVKTKIVLKYP